MRLGISKDCAISTSVLILCSLVPLGCAVAPCEDTNLGSVTSPDRRYVATSYMIDCGALGEYNLHVGIWAATEAFAVHGSGEVLALKGAFVAKQTWLDEHTLSIEVACTADEGCDAADRESFRRPVIMRDRWQGIAIRYALNSRRHTRSDKN